MVHNAVECVQDHASSSSNRSAQETQAHALLGE
jgi:hypothetical protein